MNARIGILGGGQLGKMLHSAGSKLGLPLYFVDNMSEGPVASISNHYTIGDITDYDDVISFGKDKDVVSIEIERVNTTALRQLERNGKLVFPQPSIIECIQDKSLQKQFYREHNLPTSPFRRYENARDFKSDLNSGVWQFPVVQKLCKDGYDGRGVQILKSEESMEKSFQAPFIIEEKVSIDKELAVVTCKDQDGNIAIYDPVEMVFHPEANILLYQLAPARISEDIVQQAKDLAVKTTRKFDLVGLLAIEMFLTTNGEILINEVAPRPHNSGHHTIEAALTSQYENHLRAISGLPLGAANTTSKSLLMNILGDENYSGPVIYEGLNEVLALPGVNVHIYGKTDTKPFRKMGHINIVGNDYEQLIQYYDFINRTLRVISNEFK